MNISIEEYIEHYPRYEKYLEKITGYAAHCGMIACKADTAHILSGPWEGNHACWTITDWKKYNPSLVESNSKFFQEHPKHTVDAPTVEKPVQLRICGNDDSSWSLFFTTVEEAKDTIHHIDSMGLVDMEDICTTWVFTN